MIKSQIVHEAATQRHHIRVRLPARASIGGKSYDVADISAGGIAISGFAQTLPKGAPLSLTLIIPFEGFSFNIDLTAQVSYCRPQLLGCAFDRLTREQISLLNLTIKSYLSGVVVSKGDILNTLSRDNFALARPDAPSSHRGRKFKKFIFSLLLAGMGGASVFFIGGNVYEKFARIKSFDSAVRSENMVEALLSSRDVQRLSINDSALVRIAGEDALHEGTVQEFKAVLENPAATLVSIQTTDSIAAALNGRPAYVEFRVH